MNKRKYLLGADPELFLLHSTGQPKSAIDVIEGTKDEPFKISDKGHSVQVDNVLLEFNIPPSNTPEQMYNDISFVLNWFGKNVPKGDLLSIVTSMNFPKSELNCEKALEFGCDPDFDAWKEAMNEKPDSTTSLRTAGAHIHISYPNSDMDTSVAIIKACDMFLGVPSVLFDNDKKRRSLYGKAGAFRFKNYPDGSGGAEYRTLSNFWIKSSFFIGMVFEQMDKVFKFVNNNPEIISDSELGLSIVHAIDNSDRALALDLVKKYNILDTEKYKIWMR